MSKVIFFVVLTFTLIACESESRKRSPMTGLAMGSFLLLPEAEIPAVEAKARRGDLDAARRLVSHWTVGRRQPLKAIPWMKVAARYGDADDAWNYAAFVRDKTERKKWLVVAARRGCQLAIEELEENGGK